MTKDSQSDPTAPPMPESELFELYRDIWPEAEGFVRTITPPEHREEVLDIARFNLARAVIQRRWNREDLRRWIFTVAKNVRNEVLRKHARRKLAYFDPQELERAVEASTADEPMGADDERRIALALRAVAMLSAKCQGLLFEHYYYGKHYDSMAKRRKRSYESVAKATARCLKSARENARELEAAE